MSHCRFAVVGLCLLVVLALGAAPAGAAEAPRKQPNILWIVSEDNGCFLGCYGDRFAHTPNMDRMAADGVLYLNAFANAPVCAPSRSTLITGMYASSLGTLHMRSRWPIPDDVKFYSTYLRGAGYYVMNPGKTDYNIRGNDKATWDKGKSWTDAPAGKPWMLVLNTEITHESCLHGSVVHPEFLSEPIALPPYHPDTPEIRSNWVEYYHDMTKMDGFVGNILAKLEKDGLADDTIVFYYSDHGGILPRSKRFVYDSGLHVPMIVRFGKNVQHLAPAKPGTKLDRLVSFIDLPPTLLSLAGAEIPAQFQGRAFLGPKAAEPRQYVFGFRGRMDERYDLSYTVRDKQYRYIRNFMPHRPYGQHLEYLWKMPATVSWEKAFKEGKCNAVQSAFWKAKPTEELYDEQADPYEVNNLAEKPDEAQTLDRLRTALREHLLTTRDVGLLPEPEMVARAADGTIYAMAQDPARYPIRRILEAAEVASARDAESVPKLIAWMNDPDPAVRYWAAVGCSVRGAPAATPALDALRPLLKDPVPCVRIAAGEAVCWLGHPDEGLPVLVDATALPGIEFNALLALNALEALGDIAKPAAERLNQTTRMDSEYTRREAPWLLHRLGVRPEAIRKVAK